MHQREASNYFNEERGSYSLGTEVDVDRMHCVHRIFQFTASMVLHQSITHSMWCRYRMCHLIQLVKACQVKTPFSE